MPKRKKRQHGFKSLSKIFEETGPTVPESIGTGLANVDRHILGLSPGHLVVIGSRPDVGKTSLALAVAEHASIRQGRAVGFFSLEETAGAVASRVLAAESEVPLQAVVSGHLTPAQRAAVAETRARLTSVPLFIDAPRRFEIDQLVSTSTRAWEIGQLDLLIVDYVQLLRDYSRAYEHRIAEVDAIVRRLKHLARDLEIPVVAVSQVASRERMEAPRVNDLENANPLLEHADLILLVHRKHARSVDALETDGLAEIIVAKNRTGPPQASFQVAFLPQLAAFRNLVELRETE